MADTNNAQQPRPLQMGAKGAYIVRLLMVGDSACGKTSLVLRFDQNVFSTKFVTTIGVDYRDKMVKVRFAGDIGAGPVGSERRVKEEIMIHFTVIVHHRHCSSSSLFLI